MSVRPRPVLYVHHRPELGGAPQSLRYLIDSLDRDRIEPHVYCPAGPAADAFASAGARIHRGSVAAFTHIWASTYSGRRWLLLGRELMRAPAHTTHFLSLLRQHRFEVVHLNDSPLLAAAYMSQRAGIPVVWHLRSALPENGSGRSRMLQRAVRTYASRAIAINSDVAASFDVDATVIPNAVDLNRFRPASAERARRSLGLSEASIIISYFGFLYPSKGYGDFVEAAKLVRERGFEATYLIVGGPVRSTAFFKTPFGRALNIAGLAFDHQREAEALIARLGLEDCIRLVPFTPNLAAMFQATDIVVAPSRGPELGRPILEAFASGRTVVASGSATGGGIITPNETGVLVPPCAPAELAAALAELIQAPDERARIGANARLYAEANLSPLHTARQIMDVYDRVARSASA
jgi:glycosyltransferase involved in cell wall biosynthesis